MSAVPARSPLTGGEVVPVDQLDVDSIIAGYREQIGVEVSRYFRGRDRVQIWRCQDTGYRYFTPFDVAGDAGLYTILENQPGYYRLRSEHDVALAALPHGAHVLEVGAGPGLFLDKLQRHGMRGVGLDHNASAVQLGRGRGLDLLEEALDAHAARRPGAYDAVCAFQVLEHVIDPRSFLLNCVRLLRPGGLLVVGVPNNNPYLFKSDKYHPLNCPPHHMGLWSAGALARLPAWFPLRLERLRVERLEEEGDVLGYFAARVRAAGPVLSAFFRVVRRVTPLRKLWLRFAEGRNVIAVYRLIEQPHAR